MIKSKNEYKYYLEADRISLMQKRKRPHLVSVWESDVIWKYERLLRKVEYLHNCKSKGVFYFIYKFNQYRLFRMQIKTGINVPINVFGAGLCITHLGPIVINGFAKVGNNCTLHPFTVIGISGRDSGSQVAELGNDVYISMGAKIIGKISIADSVVIAANAVVTKDITTPNTTWGGIPARKISDNGNPLPENFKGANVAKERK